MGMFDHLTCEVEVPGLGVPAGVEFQTKDLFRTFARLAIDRAGRLVQRDLPSETESKDPRSRDLEYHGDILFCGEVPGRPLAQFVARFTDGRLVWIRPLADLSEWHQVRLLNRD